MTINPKIENALALENNINTLISILFAIALKADSKLYIDCIDELKRLQELDLIRIKNNQFILVHDFYVEYTLNYKLIDLEIEKRIDEYRAVFSINREGKVGLRLGSMGDRNACIKKLRKWFRNYPNKTFDDVVNTAFYYVSNLNGNYTYLKQADYFIEKDNQSLLSALIDENKEERLSDNWDSSIV